MIAVIKGIVSNVSHLAINEFSFKVCLCNAESEIVIGRVYKIEDHWVATIKNRAVSGFKTRDLATEYVVHEYEISRRPKEAQSG